MQPATQLFALIIQGSERIIVINDRELADLLKIKGKIIYKALAYRKAADNLTSLGRNVNEYWKESKLKDIPGGLICIR